MRADKLLQVADLIAKNIDSFDMTTLGNLQFDESEGPAHVCGSPGCISGYVQGILLKDDPNFHHPLDVSMADTYEWLGLTDMEGHNLCFATGSWSDSNVWFKYREELGLKTRRYFGGNDRIVIDDITAAMAINMLRNLANDTWSFEGTTVNDF